MYVYFQLVSHHDRDMTLVTQILWGRTTHVSKTNNSKVFLLYILELSIATFAGEKGIP